MDVSTKVDRGCGWVVVAAVAFINMTNQSILSVFGLLFGLKLQQMQHKTSTTALITNLNSLVLNFSGLLIGPAIKSFKPRNVATTGCALVSFGLLLCAFSQHGWQFIIGYSFFVGLGLGLISPSTFIAINSYFKAKKGRAVGVSLAGAGLGQVFIPHLVRYLLDNYSFQTTVLSMSFMSLTGVLGALLLKPLAESTRKHNNRGQIQLLLETNNDSEKEKSKANELGVHNATSTEANKYFVCKETTLTSSTKMLTTQRELGNKILQRLVEALDLELLKDPVFLSIIIGMALVYTSTINFTMLFPTFLQTSVGLTSTSTAVCMSTVAGADILCRLILPFITDRLKLKYRVVFLAGTVGLLISRAALAESTDMPSIIVMSIFTGMTKSATVLNNNLTISGHCQPENLAGGLGLNMIAKGVLVITVGQLLGWIRDYTKSYTMALHAQNVLLLLVVLVWTPEIYYHYIKQRKDTKKTLASIESGENSKLNPC